MVTDYGVTTPSKRPAQLSLAQNERGFQSTYYSMFFKTFEGLPDCNIGILSHQTLKCHDNGSRRVVVFPERPAFVPL